MARVSGALLYSRLPARRCERPLPAGERSADSSGGRSGQPHFERKECFRPQMNPNRSPGVTDFMGAPSFAPAPRFCEYFQFQPPPALTGHSDTCLPTGYSSYPAAYSGLIVALLSPEKSAASLEARQCRWQPPHDIGQSLSTDSGCLLVFGPRFELETGSVGKSGATPNWRMYRNRWYSIPPKTLP